MNYYNIPEDERFIIDGLFNALKNDVENGVVNMTKALQKGHGTFRVIIVALKRREFRDNMPLEFLYQRYVDLMAEKGYIIPTLDEIKKARKHGMDSFSENYFKDYLAKVEKDLEIVYAEMKKTKAAEKASEDETTRTRIRATEEEKEEAIKKLGKNMNDKIQGVEKIAVDKMVEIFQNDVKVGLKALENGLKKGEGAYQLLERCLKRGSHTEEVKKVKSFLDKAYDDVTSVAKAAYDTYKTNDVQSDTVTVTSGRSSLDEFDFGFDPAELDDGTGLGIWWKHTDVDTTTQDTVDDEEVEETDAPGVPLISQNIIMFDKEVIREMLNDKILEIIADVYGEEISFDEYDKELFNILTDGLKKKERRYLKGKAENLRWTIEVFDIRVENIGHKMLSHIVANF